MSVSRNMMRFPALPFVFALVLPLYAVPLTQKSSADTLVYDAVVVGTNNVVELIPASTGLPSPFSILTNVDIVTCASGAICIDEVFTKSASKIASSVAVEFSALPASIVNALEDISGAIEADFEVGGASSNAMSGSILPSSTSYPTWREGITESLSVSGSPSGLSALPTGIPLISNFTVQVGTLRNTSALQVLSSPPASSASSIWTPPVQSTTSDVASKPSVSATSRGNFTGTVATISAHNISEDKNPPSSTYITASTVAGSLSATNTGLGGRNRTEHGTTTASSPTGPITNALEVTNSQGSLTDEAVGVGYQSGVPNTSDLFVYTDSVATTETTLPAGALIQTITTSTCTNAGSMITTTSSGSTVTTEIPELCTHGLAFLIFGLPGLHSSSDLPSLCHKLFAFPFGILWRVLCPSSGPPTISITSVDPKVLPPGGGPPGENPNGGSPDDEDPSPTQRPSQVTQSIQISQNSQTAQSTVASLAAATPSRFVVTPLIGNPQSATDSLFALYAQRNNVTQATRSDGSLKFFAVDLNDTEASTIDTYADFIIIQESELGIEMPDSGQTDPDLNGTSYATEPLDLNPNVGSRDLHDQDQVSKEGVLFKRIGLQSWAEKITAWSLAMISLVPGLPLPNYGLSETYPFYFIGDIEPGQNVRVYLLDTGLNMQHPEFNGRLKPGITRGQIQNDWDIDWLFPRVDENEWFYTPITGGGIIRQRYDYSYIDPDSPNPNGGIHPAYSDFRARQDEYGSLTPHGTRLSAFIMGDNLGQAQKCCYTVVKLPQYTNGPRAQSGVYFPLFSVKDALTMIVEDIMEKKEQGEQLFVISSALGYPFGRTGDVSQNPKGAEKGFKKIWNNFLDWCDDNGVTISAAAGNSGAEIPEISLIPAVLFRSPEIVVGSVTPNAMAHPGSQGHIGDGILTAYAPAAGARVVSSDPSGAYIYEWLDPTGHAVTSYACGMSVGYIAQTIALGYSGNAVIPPNPDEKPNAYAYRMVSSESKPRVVGGPPIIYNNAPVDLYQNCAGPGGYKKRDGSCPISHIDLPTGTDALPASVSAAIVAGDEDQVGATALGMSPTLSAAIGAIIGGISAGVAAGQVSSTLTTFLSAITAAAALCSHAADPHNTCTAIANGPGWCVCGGLPDSYLVQTSTDLACGWTTLPPTTSFDCPAAATTIPLSTTPAQPAQAPIVSPSPSIPPAPPLNAGIAIWLQQYSSTSGAEIDTWFAYAYKPGDPKLGDACDSNPDGTAFPPNGTPVSEYPAQMTISAYGRKLTYTPFFASGIGELWDADTGASLGHCTAVTDTEGVVCDSQYRLIPRVACEWTN